MSSGDVSRRTRTTLFPSLANSEARSAVKTTLPQAAPGEAGSPLPMISAFFKADASKPGWSKVSSCFGSIFIKASFSVILPSLTRSTAIFKAAFAVLFPFLVWSI